jgi:hypothetical protein
MLDRSITAGVADMAVTARQPIPLRPDPAAIAETAISSLIRAVIDKSLRTLDRNITRTEFEDDRVVGLITRGPTAPTTIADAAALATVAVSFVSSLVGVSAAAALIARSLKLTFDGAASIGIPSLTLPHAAFVSEGQPIAVVQGTSAPGNLLEPYKLATIVSLTGEMIRHSNAEALIRQVLIENVGPSLDAAMLSAAAAVPSVRPPGILHGITALTPTAAGSSAFDAMVADLEKLVTAIAPVSGNGGIVFICSPAQALAIQLRAENAPPVFSSSTLAAGTVIAVAVNALATVIDAPSIEASRDAVIHQFDPAEQIATVADGISAPVASMFQNDSVALKFRQPVAWTLRSPSAVAFMTGVNW